jgi:hypothetical protein
VGAGVLRVGTRADLRTAAGRRRLGQQRPRGRRQRRRRRVPLLPASLVVLTMKATHAALVALAAVVLAGYSTSDPLSPKWLPRLQAEANSTCHKSDCSSEIRDRMMALTEELAADAEAAGDQDLAELAEQVHAASEHWTHECHDLGLHYSPSAQMSCDAMFDLNLYGDRYLLEAVTAATTGGGQS